MSDTAIIAVITGIVTIVTTVVGFLTLWIKLKANTDITRVGAEKAAVAADKLSEQFNGGQGWIKGLDSRIHSIVKEHFEPLKKEVQAHAIQDEKNMEEIRSELHKLTTRHHK